VGDFVAFAHRQHAVVFGVGGKQRARGNFTQAQFPPVRLLFSQGTCLCPVRRTTSARMALMRRGLWSMAGRQGADERRALHDGMDGKLPKAGIDPVGLWTGCDMASK
jgi:hypothetical protein